LCHSLVRHTVSELLLKRKQLFYCQSELVEDGLFYFNELFCWFV
jgi:hypothetical protein